MTDSLDIPQRMVNAVEQVRQRLGRAAKALQQHGVPYTIVGDCAVSAWIATVDMAAVRNTQNVDILIRRTNFDAARSALEAVGFVYRHAAGRDMFLDSATSHPRHAVQIHFAGETVKSGDPAVYPDVSESTNLGALRVLNLEALIGIALTTFRINDQVNLADLIGVGLIDQSWTETLPPVLAVRLQTLLDTPDG